MAQFNDILNLVAHQECKQYLEEEQINNSDEWPDEVDERVLKFKKKVHSWWKETKDDRSSTASSKTKSHSSRSSRRSSKLNNSASSKSDRIEGKVKIIELYAPEAFLEKCQPVGNEAQCLGMQEKLATTRAGAQILDNVEFGEEQELQGKY